MLLESLMEGPLLADPSLLDPFAYIENESRLRMAIGSSSHRQPKEDRQSFEDNGSRRVGLLQLSGWLAQHSSYVLRLIGGTSLTEFQADFQSLLGFGLDAIVIEVDSPGGSQYGIRETADMVYRARSLGKPKIIAVANSYAASGALWIATAAAEFVVTAGGDAGGVGVISEYTETSKSDQTQGVKRTFVRTPPNKARFTGVEPLTDAMRATMQKRNNALYADFVRALARNRNVSTSKVENAFGQGEMLSSREAVAAGLADDVRTLHELVSMVLAGKQRAKGPQRLAWLESRSRLNG